MISEGSGDQDYDSLNNKGSYTEAKRDMNARFIITGGCGFVGANLIRQLHPVASHIRVLDNLSLGKQQDIAGLDVELIIGDIRDVNTVRKAVREMDVLVHLAAHTRVIDSIEQPRENFEVNVTGTFNLFMVCRKSFRCFSSNFFVRRQFICTLIL